MVRWMGLTVPTNTGDVNVWNKWDFTIPANTGDVHGQEDGLNCTYKHRRCQCLEYVGFNCTVTQEMSMLEVCGI